jgi:phage terminase large subunit GpA-like protein
VSATLRVLVVEDEAPARRYLVELLHDTGRARVVAAVGTAEEADACVRDGALDLDAAFVDVHLAGDAADAGLRLVRGWHALPEAPRVVLATAHAQHALAAFELGVTDYLRKRWTSEAGGEMVIETTCIDTGGSNTQAVYGYVKRHKGDRVYGVKGQGGPGLPIVGNPARRRAGKKTTRPIDVYIVGVDSAKSIVYKRLRITEPGSGYCHFPQGRSAEYFRGLTAEKAVTKFVKGFPRLEWHKTSGARNEPLDCRVYAFAALVLRAPQFDKLALRRRQTMPAPKPAEAEPPQPTELPAEDTPRPDANNAAKRKRTTRRASFVHQW